VGRVRERLGLVYTPSGRPWHVSHCQSPFVQPLTPSRHRIHFSCRDAQNRSRGGWVDVEVGGGRIQVVRAAEQPSLDLGRLGSFDDSGAMPGCLVAYEGRLRLYYTGWTLARTVPFAFFIGVAESTDGGETFRRLSEAPCLGRNRHDPFLAGAPWVLRERGRFRMWYVSATEWMAGAGGGPPVHYYSIKHATSENGIDWETNDRLCRPFRENEHAIARPVVMPTAEGYRMIYSARRLGDTYRIYGARSIDGLSWEQDSDLLLDVAPAGWDSEMVCYGSVLDYPGGAFLLYNGNGYGRDGLGAARFDASVFE
jgi:hypothetical protein